ncbi:MAG: hypothetical protein ACP5K8_05590 [Nitrososphaeria archaeon]
MSGFLDYVRGVRVFKRIGFLWRRFFAIVCWPMGFSIGWGMSRIV